MESLENVWIDNEYIKDWKAQKKKTVGTICCHIPEEIIHAAGLLPFRIRGTGCKDDNDASLWMSSFSCSYARACLQHCLDGNYDYIDGFASADGCNMMQHMFDNWKYNNPFKYSFQMNVPRMNNERGLQFFVEELRRFKAGMEELNESVITDDDLRASIKLYNETRALIRELYDLRKGDAPYVTGTETLKIVMAGMSMPKEEYNRQLREFIDEAKKREPIEDYDARLMVIGSSMDDPEYMQILEKNGAIVVTDCHCFGSRYLWEDVICGEEDDPIEAIAKCYLSRPVCPRMCNLHDELFDFIMQMVKDFNVDGIVYLRMKNCVPWGGEGAFFKDQFQEAGIPVLTLEREEITTNMGQVSVRVDAFTEMIEGGFGDE